MLTRASFIVCRGLLVLGVVLALGAGRAVAGSPQEPWTCSRLVYALLDLSGSYAALRERAVEELKRVVVGLRPGECLILKSISHESWNDSNTLLGLRLPPSPRAIDPGHQRRVAQAKSQALLRLEGLKGKPKDPYTDLWCSLFVASQALQHGTGGKELLVFSDFRDNQRRKACQQLRLQGVTVTGRLIPRGEDPAAFDRRIRFWASALRQAGAAAVALHDMDGLPVVVEKDR